MKLTVIDWERVQNECFTDEVHSETFRDENHRDLHAIIEDRTWGKRYSSEVAIGLNKSFTAIATEALARANARRTAATQPAAKEPTS
jgi:hypothetical protein